MTGFIPTWAGECSAWECDGLGHMNMRHYMTKVQQARQMLIMRLGLAEAFQSGTPSSVRVRDFHIKYLGEARPDDPLRIESGIIEIGEHDLTACHVMYHHDNRLAATIVETIEHIYLPTQRLFNWPKRAQAAAKSMMISQPAPSKPRGFDYGMTSVKANEATLIDWGMTRIGMGVFRPDETGLDGHIKPEALLGRTTETIGHFRNAWPEMHDEAYRDDGGAGALLEARIFINAPAEAGQPYHFYSGIKDANTHTRTLVHHMVDALTGESLFSMVGIGCLFNLKSRKLTKATPEQITGLMKHATPDIVA